MNEQKNIIAKLQKTISALKEENANLQSQLAHKNSELEAKAADFEKYKLTAESRIADLESVNVRLQAQNRRPKIGGITRGNFID